jgi:ubiquinone/menaquinone biosynthesis C-methylase UbiE
MPDVKWNLAVWDRDYKWPQDGDEWTQQAEYCGVSYEQWKESLARTFLIPYLKESTVVLEIGPGHGRWSSMMPQRVSKGTVHLVDLSKACLDFCKKRFEEHHNVQYWPTNGKTLPPDLNTKVDFVFSFDTFVHIEEPEVRSYVKELYRVLKPNGMGVIHHSGSPSPEQRACGARSQVGTRLFGDILRDAGFYVIRQTSEWGAGCNVKLASDIITVFVKP